MGNRAPRRYFKLILFILSAPLAVLALPSPICPDSWAQEPPQAAFSESDWVEYFQSRLGPYQKDLKETLLSSVAEKGIQASVESCKAKAPKVTREHGQANDPGDPGVFRVGRATLKARNPRNAPEAWMKPLIESFRKDPELKHRLIKLGKNGATWGYAEPIRIQPMCLSCHGEKLPPSVREAIASRYPDDAATGYKLGDFRGIWWATYEAR